MEMEKLNTEKKDNQDNSRPQTGGLDKSLFGLVSVLLFLICTLLAVNLYLQWNNYNQGIRLIIDGGLNRHDAIITYSRAMDFAFVKTSTIFLGFVLVFVGALYLLRLNESAYSIGINKGDAKVTFQTASPGLVLVTLGVVTILVTTYNKSYISFPVISSSSEVSQRTDIDDLVNKISFKRDSTELNEKSINYVEKICSYMKEHNVTNIAIEAHGDGDKSREYEMELAGRRGEALKNILQQRCSYSFSSNVISYGEEPPGIRDEGIRTGVSIKFN